MPEDFVKAAQTGEVLPGKMKVGGSWEAKLSS